MTKDSAEARITIQAIFPHAEDPSRHLRTETGEYPTETHEDGTWESTFRKIGSNVLGAHYVGVDRRSPSLSADTPRTIVYISKPVNADPLPDSPFQWRRADELSAAE